MVQFSKLTWILRTPSAIPGWSSCNNHNIVIIELISRDKTVREVYAAIAGNTEYMGS